MFLLCSDRRRDGRGSEQVEGDPANAGYADLMHALWAVGISASRTTG